MLALLRNIRRSLLSSGSTRKYLLYAIGEIALVVIGILIALQINNWNEERKQSIEEIRLLSSINEQFKFNLNELDRAIWTTKMVQDKCILLLDNMGSKGVKLSRYESDSLVWSGLRRIVTYDVSNGILDDILNSGKLHIISSDPLREKLANWQSILNDVKEDETWAVQMRNSQILPFLQRYYSTFSSFSMGITSGFEWDYKQIYLMKEFENLVDQHRHWNNQNEYSYSNLRNYIEDILSLCSKELTNRNK